jgi:hypothetical protein
MALASDSDRILRSIEALIENRDFECLNQRLSQPTLFDVLGISEKEHAHSRMLGWLLDPTAPHGLGSTVLRRFLYEAAKLTRSANIEFDGNGFPITPLQAETFSFSDVTLLPEYCIGTDRRLDLILWSDTERWLCVIENKIRSDEGEAQTSSYYDKILSRFPPNRYEYRLFVYLSPKGNLPVSRRFTAMNYSTIAGLLLKGGDSASDLGRTAISQYVSCLKGRIVTEEQFEEQCWKLYRTYRAAIDVISPYSKNSILATRTQQRVLELLRRPARDGNPGHSLEWETTTVKPTSERSDRWIAIFPKNWPIKQLRYPGFYKISWETGQIHGETVGVGLGFDKPNGPTIRSEMEGLAGEAAGDLLPVVPVTAKDWEGLPRAVDEASERLVSLIEHSLLFLETALRKHFPKHWKGPDGA